MQLPNVRKCSAARPPLLRIKSTATRRLARASSTRACISLQSPAVPHEALLVSRERASLVRMLSWQVHMILSLHVHSDHGHDWYDWYDRHDRNHWHYGHYGHHGHDWLYRND